jgi:leucyl aminopeptidase
LQITVSTGGLDAAQVEVAVLPMFEDGLGDSPAAGELDRALEGALSRGLAEGDLSGKPHKVAELLAPGGLAVRRILLVGAGKRADWSQERARTVTGAAVRTLRGRGAPAAAVILPTSDDPIADVAAATHGAELANWSPGRYKTGDNAEADVSALVLLAPGGEADALGRAVERSTVLGQAANLARELANEPGNRLTPTAFAEEARRVGEACGLGVEVMEEPEMEERGYGAILSVSKGSQEPARLVTLSHKGPEGAPTVGLVGKGITFDSGGISLKPGENMHLMKTDMSGAAAVLGAMHAISKLGPQVNVVAVLCIAENMPGPAALRPGDVLTAGNGKTIEVLNTDAEGRLVLADGLTHARAQGATHLVDVATLTGSCVVALGSVNTGVFGSSDEWTQMLLDASRHTGERMWQLPVQPEYREQLNSEIADMANVGGREGGAIVAASFLQEFAGDQPWVHLDIAGTARNKRDLPYLAKGPTGVATATLARLVEEVAQRGVPA